MNTTHKLNDTERRWMLYVLAKAQEALTSFEGQLAELNFAVNANQGDAAKRLADYALRLRATWNRLGLGLTDVEYTTVRRFDNSWDEAILRVQTQDLANTVGRPASLYRDPFDQSWVITTGPQHVGEHFFGDGHHRFTAQPGAYSDAQLRAALEEADNA